MYTARIHDFNHFAVIHAKVNVTKILKQLRHGKVSYQISEYTAIHN